MGYGDISANNANCPFETVNLDQMCRRGMRFTDAHATSAVCTPSRYGILTGRYNWRSTLKSYVIGGYSQPLISEGRTTVADLLKKDGYFTACIGKWHLGMQFSRTAEFRELPDFEACPGVDYSKPIKRSPVSNGFDFFYGISGSLDMPPYVYIENDRFTAIPNHETSSSGKAFWRKGPTAPGFDHTKVLDELTQKALNYIESHRDFPFFLYFPMPAPHTPILPDGKFQGKSHTNAYGDFVLHCDDVVGRIRRKLAECGIEDDTILVYTSDNGCSPMADYPELLAHGHNPSYVFRGTKADIYEGGHRVPLIVQWPARISGNQTCNSLVCLSDLMATVAEINSIKLKDSEGEDSVSNLPLWDDPGAKVRDNVVHQSIDGSLSIRECRWKLEMCPGSGGWSYPRPGIDEIETMPRFQLYDLETDIGERINVINSHPEIFHALKEELKHQVENGRSTPGAPQQNDGWQVWDTVRWLAE